MPGGTAGIHAVTATGGSYVDESTGGTVNLTSEMLGLIVVGGSNVGNVTPITHAIVVNGAYRVQLGASISSAFNGAIGDMTTALGFDPTTVVPGTGGSLASPASVANMDIYTAILAGFSVLLDDNPALAAFDNAATWDIVDAIALDLTDGKLDGVTIVGAGIFVDDGTGTFLPFPPLSINDISNLINAAVDWAAIHLPDVTIPLIDLSIFGNPVITPGGDWEVSGTLTVTGTDAENFGETFTPTSVTESVGGDKVDGFTFFAGDLLYWLSIGFDSTTPAGTLNSVAANRGEFLWVSLGELPINGAGISLTAPYTVTFANVTLSRVGSEETLILNGALTATPK